VGPDERCDDHGSQPPGWKRKLHAVLKDGSDQDIEGPNGPIKFRMEGRVDQDTHELTVTVNGWEAEHTNDHAPPPAPHQDRGRKWHINNEFPLLEKGTGAPVLDKDGKPVRVRVQAYPYEYDPALHPQHCPDAQTGWGPKMRIWAV
jgi:hypothetical protein